MNKCIAHKKMKTRYPSREAAELHAELYSTKKMRLYTYQCKVCRQFHLTKQKQAN